MNINRPQLLAFLFLLALFAAVSPVAADEGYTVQPGDNLYRIALRHGLTTAELAAANGIANPDRIYVGQVLTIPEGESTDSTVTEETAPAAPAGPLSTAAQESVDGALAAIDGAAAEAEALREATTWEHVVQAGDTLSRIARRYGVTTAALVRINNLASPNLIYPGQKLRIPQSGAVNPAEVAAPAAPAGGYKQIVVDKSEQRAYIYQDGQLLWTFVISTGMPGSETWDGTFHVRSKIPNAYAYNWGLQMPYWLGFYHTGYLENGFHALPIMSSGAILWEGYLGTPVSYGCVILSYPDAETLYNWAEIGTEVVVRP